VVGPLAGAISAAEALAEQGQWQRALELLRAARAAGRSTGLVELYEPGVEAGGRKRMHDDLRAEVDGQAVRVLVYGESVSCDRLEHLSGSWDLRFLPEIRTVE
jgi:hypothetical protein